MRIVENCAFDEERALYGVNDVCVSNCRFDGPADGESAFKECRDVEARGCYFNLRYPFWHDSGVLMERCELTDKCRAALWYTDHVRILDSKLHGVKALRECRDVELRKCDVVSPEFGWNSRDVALFDTTVESEYFMLNARNLRLRNVKLTGKYSFQYVAGAEIDECEFDTKDAFWHSSHMTVRDSVITGEYLGWYSDHLTLINCTIAGTQPLCYCTDLRLENCRMEKADLAFEKSDVTAELNAPLLSVKNPARGKIRAPQIGEVIRTDANSRAEIIIAG